MLLIETTIQQSGIHGFGCFANAAIKSGQLVWVYDRRVERLYLESRMSGLAPPIQSYIRHYGYASRCWFGRCYVLCGDNARYMNHSDNPSVVDNVADRDINIGEEMTCNYFTYDLDASVKLGRNSAAAVPDAFPPNQSERTVKSSVSANGRTVGQHFRRLLLGEEAPFQANDQHSPRNCTDEYSFSLKPSALEGIGVFANHAIARGTRLRLFSEPRGRRIRRSSPTITPERRNFLKRYCIEKEAVDAFFGPRDFGRMSVGWYLNHSAEPNAAHRRYRYFATRDIAGGEEITIDYGTLETRFAQGPAQFP